MALVFIFHFSILTPQVCHTTCSHAMIFSVLIIHSNYLASVRFVQSVCIFLGEHWSRSCNIQDHPVVSQSGKSGLGCIQFQSNLNKGANSEEMISSWAASRV